VAVLLTVLLGFAALTVDVGAIYNAKAELQRTADSAALAAAAMLGEYGAGNPLEAARQKAIEYVTQNQVLGQSMALDPATDVVFGRAQYQAEANAYSFTPTEVTPDAVQVRVRMTNDSPNGPLGLFFGAVLGRPTANVAADAIAMMVPRDIAIVADMSGSHNDDSCLGHYQLTTINLHDVWDAFPGGIDDSPEEWEGLGYTPNDPQAAGPGWGYLKHLGYGTDPVTAEYQPQDDSGLISLPAGANWSDAGLNTYLSGFQGAGYDSTERSLITNKDSGAWEVRVAAALGLARWNSGRPGGLWERLGTAKVGDGDSTVEDFELQWVELFGDRNLSKSRNVFQAYIGYMSGTNNEMYHANHNFRYRFGVKTFINFVLEKRPENNKTPELANAPTQPMQAVKDSVEHLVSTLYSLNSTDLLSLEIYGTTARHEVNLTTDFALVSGRLSDMQAAYYDSLTNMGGGILRGVEELTGPRHRSAARKIMILLTDGYANVNSDGEGVDFPGGRAYAVQSAHTAADQGIRIFAVSVGAWCDLSVMDEIAAIGSGQHFHAEGSIEDYSEQLDGIFVQLGGQRPVELIK